jgi:GxxExxY protein
MEKSKEEINKITEKIIGCAIEVHKNLGPGLLESVYEKSLFIELEQRGIKAERQKIQIVEYKKRLVGEFRIDILVEDCVVLELKSVERFDPVFEAQILSYMKLGGYKIGLLINFNSKLLIEGIKRYIL